MRKFDQKKHFFEWSSWFNVNHMGLATGLALKSHASVAKELKLKVRKCWELIFTFEKVTWGKLLGGVFFTSCSPHSKWDLPKTQSSEIDIQLHNMKIQKCDFKSAVA